MASEACACSCLPSPTPHLSEVLTSNQTQDGRCPRVPSPSVLASLHHHVPLPGSALGGGDCRNHLPLEVCRLALTALGGDAGGGGFGQVRAGLDEVVSEVSYNLKLPWGPEGKGRDPLRHTAGGKEDRKSVV